MEIWSIDSGSTHFNSAFTHSKFDFWFLMVMCRDFPGFDGKESVYPDAPWGSGELSFFLFPSYIF